MFVSIKTLKIKSLLSYRKLELPFNHFSISCSRSYSSRKLYSLKTKRSFPEMVIFQKTIGDYHKIKIIFISSNLIKELFEKYLDKSCYRVIEGQINVAKNISYHPWDLIIFTGSPEKGKLVSKAASENLVPCILELGGKSPTIVDSDANIESAALRISASKFSNCG